ncbi:MAG: hypothetical protein G01um101425_481 [Candidatus Peregrinibacteria bacterium Gr01-1014_25]|nr:MAG: hypothetical protein G01um101425_481 [Candidatus Peregrinibacteria bacterium Gr01-1014_25]
MRFPPFGFVAGVVSRIRAGGLSRSQIRWIGAALLLLALLLAWCAERHMDVRRFASRAEIVDANAPLPIDQPRLVAATGLLNASVDVGDESLLPPGPFIALKRTVEMFSWMEDVDSSTDEPLYRLDWTETPPEASGFLEPAGHENPPKSQASMVRRVGSARVGVLAVDVASLTLPSFRPLQLSPESVLAAGYTLKGNALYRGSGTPDDPNIGDIRIRYSVVPQSVPATLFGVAEGTSLRPYVHPGGTSIYHLYYGYREDALRRIGGTDAALWLSRAAAVALLWLAALLLLLPFPMLLPSLQRFHPCLQRFACLPVALLLYAASVALLSFVFSIWILLAFGVLALLLLLLLEHELAIPLPPPATSAPLRQPSAPRPTPQSAASTAPLSLIPAAPLPAAQRSPIKTIAPLKTPPAKRARKPGPLPKPKAKLTLPVPKKKTPLAKKVSSKPPKGKKTKRTK